MQYLIILGFVGGQLLKLPYFNLGGITALDLLCLIFCLLSIFKLLGQKIKINLPIYFKFGLSFIGICLISLLLSPLHLTTIERLVSFSYTIRFGIYLLTSFFVSLNFFAVKKNTSNVLILSGAMLATLGLLQLIFIPDLSFLAQYGWDPHFFRTVSTFLDPNFAGAFFGLTLVLLFLNLDQFKLKERIILFTIVFIALTTTFSRGSYLLFGVSFLTISLFKKSLKALILTAVLSSVLIVSFFIYQPFVAAPKNVSREKSAEARVGTWEQGLEIFNRAPLLGVGFNSYRFALQQFQLAPPDQINSHGGASNDSSLLFVLDTTGIIGLIIYLGFLFAILWTAWQQWQRRNIWGLIVFSGLLGLVAQSFFANTLFYPQLLGYLMFSLAQLSPKTSS